ncbi:AMP-binding protein [Nocardioidaceae bacterium]|nr:AMP-binding protein [Nocardioidaceae bacterium]
MPEAERRVRLEVTRPVLTLDDPAVVPAVLAAARARAVAPVPLNRPMHCTSGTTGVPKGVWSGLLEEEAARALVAEERETWGFSADDVNLVVSPLHHSAPLRFAVGTALAGGRVVVAPKPRGGFDPAAVTATIESDRPSTVFCVPTHLQRLFEHWDALPDGPPDLSGFRLLAHAGAPCPPDVKRRLIATFPAGSTWEFYGSTEGQFTACRSEDWLERPGTVGRARPGRTLSVDEDAVVWCAVPEHARFSYLGDPEKTAAAWKDTPEGPAFTVGDLGRLEDGWLFLDARREDLVISGGVNVYPAEVEAALREHDGVSDVAVFGRDDARWGQRVCAAYVGDADAGDLTAYARTRLAAAQRPKEWHRVAELPRTPTGKVQRAQLPTHLALPD